jgi:hypothetical protein
MKEIIELIIKFINNDGKKHTIKFNLSDVNIVQNRDVIRNGNKVNLIIEGIIKKNYEN